MSGKEPFSRYVFHVDEFTLVAYNMRMTQAERIISKFGGLSAMSRALGHKNPTTVQGWKDRGIVPMRQVDAVLAAAVANDIAITHADFFAVPGSRESKPKRAVQ